MATADEMSGGSNPPPTVRPSVKGDRSRPLRSHGPAFGVFVAALIVTVAASIATHTVYNRNENRLLDLRVRDAATAISGAIPGVETPLAAADELAQATDGNIAQFKDYMASVLRARPGTVSGSLWTLGPNGPTLRANVGAAPDIAATPTAAARFFEAAEKSGLLGIMTVNGPSGERVGYAYAPKGSAYLVYEESALAKDRRAKIASDSSFANLHYAIYFGHDQTSADLLTTDEANLPITGRTAAVVVPFGSGVFTLVMTPATSLGGAFFASLWWVIGLLGLLIGLGAAILVERLVRRRASAEAIASERDQVANEIQHLYDEQRNIAETLQHALLPETLPPVPGVEISARYLPGVRGMDIGGDWYDVVTIDEQRFLLVVGDVSGRGLRAATVMAELRYAIRAYLAAGDSPAAILTRLTQLHDLESDGHFATVLLALADLGARTLTIANAGHLNPLLIADGVCTPVETHVGTPVGVSMVHPYEELVVDLPRGATFVAFTDGLVERRGQSIDESLAALATIVGQAHGALAELLDSVLEQTDAENSDDDTAILGVRWLN